MTSSSSSSSSGAVDAARAPVLAMVGKPALQSSRLAAAEYTTAISKTLLKKVACLLTDLGAPVNPLPTARVCDLYDKVSHMLLYLPGNTVVMISLCMCLQVRRDAVGLLSLQSLIGKKEREIAALRAAGQLGDDKGN